MNAKTANYTADPGEIVDKSRRTAEMLPPRGQLALRDYTVKVTLSLSRRSVEFVKREAAKVRMAYQQMIRAMVD